MFESLEKPATKKDFLVALGLIALTVWLSDSDGFESGLKQLREKIGGAIAGKLEAPK